MFFSSAPSTRITKPIPKHINNNMGKFSLRPSMGSRPSSGVFEKSSRPSSGVFSSSSRPSSGVFDIAEIPRSDASEASSRELADLAQDLKVRLYLLLQLCAEVLTQPQALADQAEQHKQHNLDNFVQILSHLNGLPAMLEHLGQIQDVVSLNQTIGQQSQQIADLEARLAASEAAHKEEATAHTTTKDELSHCKANVEAKDERIHHLKSLLTNIDQDVKDARLALETKDLELSTLKTEVSKLNSLVAFQDQEHAQLSDSITAKEDEIKQLHEGLAGNDAELAHTKTVLAQLDAQIESKNQELHSLRTANELTFRQLLESQTASMEQLFQQQTHTTDALTQQIVELKQQVRLQQHLEVNTPPASAPVSPAVSMASNAWGMPGLAMFGGKKPKMHKRSQSQIVIKAPHKFDVPVPTML
ncbi:hypothetical protein D6D15_08326 [Aureobasidium pullulans]|uniref:Uncharacterized protein n=1 Tax=Aureobasidium pullulans TaxID=5580 RepID=A0A4S9AZN3_AURPU|nr:hypothetical protein D6D15_08326 [Aureobasidium pullulans]